MIRFSPTVLYGIIAMLIICLLLGAVTLPNASRWFQGAHASIQQDLIVLLGNSTSLKSDVAYGHHEWQYSQNLVAVDNTPMPAESGLQGILYDRGLSCTPTVNNTLPSLLQESSWKVNLSRIALIQLGGCQLVEKLQFAQNDGASAVILYDNASFVAHISGDTPEEMRIDPNKVYIPAYHVDGKTGKELYERLANLTQWEISNRNTNNTMKNEQHGLKNGGDGDALLPSSHLITRVTMYPDQRPFLEPWQFAMIVIGVVIITSTVIVIAVQCHLCHLGRKRRLERRQRQRRRRRQRQQQLASGMDGEYTASYFIDDDDDDNDDDNNNMAQESFWLQLISAARTEDEYHNNQETDRLQQPSRQEKKKRYRLHPSVLESIPTREWNGTKTDADQCVICLESFSPGDMLRSLPCEHEYHRDCIDVWLTKKNACCPLCLQLAVTLPTIPEPVYMRDHRQHHQDLQERNRSSNQHDERMTHTDSDFTSNQPSTITQQQHFSTDSSLRHTWFASQTTSTSSLSSLSSTAMHDAYD